MDVIVSLSGLVLKEETDNSYWQVIYWFGKGVQRFTRELM